MTNKRGAKTDAMTVALHWSLVLTLLISLATGFRIAADAPDAGWEQALTAILPQGTVTLWHSMAAMAVGVIAVAYVVFLVRARLIARVALDRARRRRLVEGNRRGRLRSLNTLLYWVAFAIIGASLATGIILYFYPDFVPFWLAAEAHRWLAWTLVAYTALHVAAQLALGGVRQLVKILNPRAAYGAAAIGAIALAGTAGAGFFTMHRLAVDELKVVETVLAPTLDGSAADLAWASAPAVEIATGRGVNSPDGEVVTVRMVHDGVKLYTLFQWPDPNRSRKHLPLVKTERGWRVLQDDFARADEDGYYEDKFAVMFARTAQLAGAGTSHLGPRPLPDRPAPAGGRGLHYTADGSMVDVWHWKSVRTGSFGQIDDNHFGPPLDADPATSRYTGGYTQDPKAGGGYSMNWERFSPDVVVPKRLPADPATIASLQSADLDPSASNDERFWLALDETVPYRAEADDYPVGTVMPSVLVEGPHEGDRGDVRAEATWQGGAWTLETARDLDTGSAFDIAIDPTKPTYMWVAVFNHTQTRHSQHLHPVRLSIE